MKNYSQITFEFQEPSEQEESAGVGVRIKSLKKNSRQPTPADGPNPDVQPASQSLFGDLPAEATAPVDGPTEGADDTTTKQPAHELSPGIAAGNAEPGADTVSPQEETILDLTSLPVTTAAIEDSLTNHTAEADIEPVNDVEAQNAATRPLKSTRGRKSLKSIDDGAERINIPPDEQLFKKQYYAIGEVAEMFQVNQSLLRFWETEFDIIQPRKNRKGDRHFRPVDIKNLLLIHDLLRRRKLTIEGAKDFLKKNKRSPERFAMIQSLQKIKGFLLEVRASL